MIKAFHLFEYFCGGRILSLHIKFNDEIVLTVNYFIIQIVIR